ncbi:thioredoxin family protein [Candidatus Falkowbacteria bacterium]|nr:thioredoxin family protein [Candidatus Falkowbacteria bacterium]
MIRIAFTTLALGFYLFGAVAAQAQDFRLLMVEQAGCTYCIRWNDEIGPIYPKTAEGAIAPLERVNLRGPWPEGLVIGARPVFTPTFLILKEGVEVGRIEGYPGEDFFWGLLGQALREAGAEVPEPSDLRPQP